jgi:release factor glutamine methyltransferase
MGEGTVSWAEVAEQARRQLIDDGRGALAADVRRIVEEATGCEPADYHDQLDEPATVRALARFDAMLARRRAGEPLQYVLGRWGFRRLDLLVDRRVLIPRPETESVVDVALAEIDRLLQRHGPTAQLPVDLRLVVADLGTGSGAVGLAIATERLHTEVWATDVSADALAVARANLAGAGRAAARVQLRQGSWYDALPEGLQGAIALIVSNPPYVAAGEHLPDEVERWEPPGALRSGVDGLDAARTLIAGAPHWLSPGGALVLELAPGQLATAARLAAASGFAWTDIRPDLAGRDRCLVARLAG